MISGYLNHPNRASEVDIWISAVSGGQGLTARQGRKASDDSAHQAVVKLSAERDELTVRLQKASAAATAADERFQVHADQAAEAVRRQQAQIESFERVVDALQKVPSAAGDLRAALEKED